MQAAGVSEQAADLLHVLLDHPAGYRVDGRRTHRLVKTRLGYPTDALSAVDDNANSLCFPHLGIDQGVTGDIRVITAVLPDGTAYTVRGQMDVLHRQCQLHALGCQ